MADGFIQVPIDQAGKRVETNEFTRYDGTVVERQRFEIPAPVIIDGDVARQILVELRIMNHLNAQAFGITDDLDNLRADMAFTDRIP